MVLEELVGWNLTRALPLALGQEKRILVPLGAEKKVQLVYKEYTRAGDVHQAEGTKHALKEEGVAGW